MSARGIAIVVILLVLLLCWAARWAWDQFDVEWDDVECTHVPGNRIEDPFAPDAFDHPATWCPECKVWMRHEAYPPPKERPPHDAPDAA